MPSNIYPHQNGLTLNFTNAPLLMLGAFASLCESASYVTNTGLIINEGGIASPCCPLDNLGTIYQTASISTWGTLLNQAGGIYDIQGDYGFQHVGSFVNSGLLQKSAGTGTSAIATNGTFNSLGGTIEVDSGTLVLGATAYGGFVNTSYL